MAMKWAYSINAWNITANSARKQHNERNFKTIVAGGLDCIQMKIATYRMKPLGRPLIISQVYGGVKEFDEYLKNIGIKQIAGWDYDPTAPYAEENCDGRDPTDPAQHEGIVDALVQFAEFLKTVGGDNFCVRPMGALWRAGEVTDEKLKAVAECWNKVGRMSAQYGVKVILDPDFLCAANSLHAIDVLMANTDKENVFLAIDTAALALVGIDPVEVYEKYADRVAMLRLEQVFTTDELNERAQPFAEDILSTGGERGLSRWFWEMGAPEGEGLVDFPKLISAAKNGGFDGWCVVCTTQSEDPSASVLFNEWYVENVLKKI
ncbi:MAG: TIM barrel protein [Oscillospiraceae bacterium]|nr:TIM barrel protein [Oscillospiraceae bacterium]